MAQNIDDIKWLYGKLKAQGYDIGNEDEFTQSLSNEDDRKWYYDKATQLGLDVGTQQDFDDLFGVGSQQPQHQTQSGGQTPTPAYPQNDVIPGWIKSAQTPMWYNNIADSARKRQETKDNAQSNETTASPTPNDKTSNNGVVEGSGVVRNDERPVNTRYSNLDNDEPLTDEERQSMMDWSKDATRSNKQFNNWFGQQDRKLKTSDFGATKTAQWFGNDRTIKSASIDDMTNESYRLKAMRGQTDEGRLEGVNELQQSIDDQLEANAKKQERAQTNRMYHNSTYGAGMDDESKAQLKDTAALMASKRLLQEAEDVIDAASNGGGGFWQAMGDKMSVKTWVPFVEGEDQSALLAALKKSDSGQKLTKAEETLLEASVYKMMVDFSCRDQLSGWYKAGETTGTSLPFMAEFMLNPMSGAGKGIASQLSKYALKKWGEKMLRSKALNIATKIGSRLAGDAVAATAMTATTSAPGVAADYASRLADNYDISRDDNGRIQAQKVGDLSEGEAMARAFASRWVENQSEMVFNAFGGGGKVIRKLIGDKSPDWAKNATKWLGERKPIEIVNRIIKDPTLRRYAERAQFHGVFGEDLEEVYNNFINAAMGEMSWSDALSFEQNLETFYGLLPTSVAFGMIGLGGMVRTDYRINKRINELYQGMSPADRAKADALVKSAREVDHEAVMDYVKSVLFDKTMSAESKRKHLEMAAQLGSSSVAHQLGKDMTEEQRHSNEQYRRGREMAQSINDGTTDIYTAGKDYDNALAQCSEDTQLIVNEAIHSRMGIDSFNEAIANLDEEEQRKARTAYMEGAEIVGLTDAIEEQAQADADSYAKTVGQFTTGEGKERIITTAEMTLPNEDKPIHVFVAEVNGDKAVVWMGGKKEMVSTDKLSNINKVYYDGHVAEYTNRAKQAALDNLNMRLNHHPQTQAPAKGLVINKEDGSQIMVGDKVGENSYSVVSGVMGAEGFQPTTQLGGIMSADEILAMQDSYYNSIEANEEATSTDYNAPQQMAHQLGEELQTADGGKLTINNVDSVNGTYTVETEDAEGNTRVQSLTEAQLEAMLPKTETETTAESPAETSTETKAEDTNTDTEATATNEAQATNNQTAPTSGQTATSGESVLSRIPKDEKGNPVYEQTDAETAWNGILEEAGGNEELAQAAADSMVKDKEAALKAAEKAKAKGGATIKEKIASEQARLKAIEDAKKGLEHWQKIAGVNAERRKSDASQVSTDHENDIVWPEPTVGSSATTNATEVVDSSDETVEGETVDRGDGLLPTPQADNSRGVEETEEPGRNEEAVSEDGGGYAPSQEGASRSGVDDNAQTEEKSSKDDATAREHRSEGVRPMTDVERALRDEIVSLMRKNGLEVITDEKEGQRVLDWANRTTEGLSKGLRLAIDAINEESDKASTANENDSSRHTEASSDSTAKVDNRIELPNDYKEKLSALVKRIENGEEITPEDFLLAIEDALGSHNENVDKSQYFKGVNDTTLRLANHRGSATMFLVHDHATGNTSVVVKMSEQKSKKNKEVDLKEFVYFPDKMNADVQRTIINGLREWGETGAYNQPCDQINVSTKKDGARLMKVYHGSGADFDAFDHSHMGEGEGAQAYGWGTYVTEVEGIGREYAKVYGDGPRTGEQAELRLRFDKARENLNSLRRMHRKIKSYDGFIEYMQKDIEDTEDEAKRYDAAFRKVTANALRRHVEKLKSKLNKAGYDEALEVLHGKIAEAKLVADEAKKEYDKVRPVSTLYTIDIPEDNGSNYLDWNGRVSDMGQDVMDSIDNELTASGWHRSEIDDFVRFTNGDKKIILNPKATGADLYAELEEGLGSDKTASDFLSSLGFVGIKYPAQNTTGGRADNAQNYVIFKESDAKITDKVRFFRTENGEAYGYTVGGKIYIDPRIATAETPIHEYAHLWASALKAENPKEWKNVVSLMKGTSIWDEVKERYPELKTDDAIADEVLAHYSGRRGAERLREEERKAKEEKDIFAMAEKLSAIDRLRRALDAFWKGVADFLHIHYTSAEEVADRVMKDLMDGVDPRKFGKTDETLRMSEEEELKEIVAKAKADGTYMKAPNGQPSNLNERQWAQVRTKAFKKWFGDWENDPENASKVVDENGEPKVMYHQTNSTIWVNRETGENYEDLDWKAKDYWQNEASQEEWEETWEEQDFYTFDNKNHGRRSVEMPAYFFAPEYDEYHEYGDRTIEAFLNIKNPAVNPKIEDAGVYNDSGEKAMQKLIDEGYDGFIREEDGTIDEINAFYPNQIKSATDNVGTFDANNNDIRFQFVGEKGAEAADHAEEVTTRLDNLAVAREMEEAKKDAKAIKMATGWERGGDGKWRYEIGDLEIKDPSEWIDKSFVRLEDIVSGENANELFAAYPELKEVGVWPSDKTTRGASYDPRKKVIRIGEEYITYTTELPSTLSHEIQHAIQELEGFALGGSPSMMDLESVRHALKEDYQNAYEYLLEVGKKYGVSVSDVEEGRYSDADANEELRDAVAYYRAARDKTGNLPNDRYMVLGGETEARNVEKRMGMTPEERRASLASETEDVSREDQIFLFYERDKEIELRKELDEVDKRRYEILNEYGIYGILRDDTPYDKYVEYSKLDARKDQIKQELKYLDTLFVGRMGSERLGWENGQMHMGTRTDKHMAEIGAHYKGKALTDEERAVVDVYSGKKDRETVVLTNKDGSSISLEMQQGNEPNAGTRHSIFRHVGKNNGSISYDEIILIPDIVKTGERTDKGANVIYQKKIDGVRYIVYTDKKSNKELFHDFYSNRKTAGSKSLSGESTNTQSSARTSDNAVSAANIGTNSESASVGEENSSEEDLFRTVYGGNSGYVGYSKSKRAVQAENEGKRSVSNFDKAFVENVNVILQSVGAEGITIAEAKRLAKNTVADEWHHTSMYGNRTDYYSPETIAYAAMDKPQRVSYDQKKDAEWNEEVEAYHRELEERQAQALKEEERKRVQNEAQREATKEVVANHPELVPIQREGRIDGYWVNLDGVHVRLSTYLSDMDRRYDEGVSKKEAKRTADEYLDGLKAEVEERTNNALESAENSLREGNGEVTDEELSLANDPISKALGQSRFSAKQRKEFADRERERMVNRVTELAEKLHLDNVEIVTDASTLSGQRAKAKGFFNPRTGKITIVVPNNYGTFDAEQTLLHEAVAHYGLRQLFGEHFDTFLDNVYKNAEKDVKGRIDALMEENGWDERKATEEYLASLAEDTDFENVNATWWSKVKEFFADMLRKLGFEDGFVGSLSDNELRYVLWRSYENLREQGKYNSLFSEAKDLQKQDELKVGPFTTEEENGQKVADLQTEIAEEEGVLFRRGGRNRGGTTPIYDRTDVRGRYDNRINEKSFQVQEALQDSMLSVKDYMNMVLDAEGSTEKMEDMDGFENPYTGENRLSSVNKAESDRFGKTLFKDLLQEVAKFAKDKASRAELTDYMFAKHGLERNDVMARRDAHKKAEDEIARAEKAANAHPNDAALHKRWIDLVQNQKQREDDLYKKNRNRDYAGLTALTGMKDVASAEAEARNMVAQYEASHKTDELWKKVNAVSDAILKKSYESGMISRATYERLSLMYKNYIPLRGFDKKVAVDVYGYLTDSHGNGAFSSAIRNAKGRTSKADEPLAQLWLMMDRAISQGNRNVMVKQAMMNFAKNHPSNLITMSDLWIHYNAVNGTWEPILPNILPTDTPWDVADKIKDFESKMEQESQLHPNEYQRAKDAPDIPYKPVNGVEREHQIVVMQNGKSYVMTVNGNPRLAQAINGMLTPDSMEHPIAKLFESINRGLSVAYTTANPNFVLSNGIRDTLYANLITLPKEGGAYSARFTYNWGKVNPARMTALYAKYMNGTLNRNNYIEDMFYKFIMNGGETGFLKLDDLRTKKKKIANELARQNGQYKMSTIREALGDILDTANRGVENTARFAAFLTSMESGRSISRSIYDAKEITVNFNKKGAGGKTIGLQGQTTAGNIAAIISSIGRGGYVFWNAAIQGTANFTKVVKKNPKGTLTGLAAMFAMGVLAAYLGGDDDDDEGAGYFDMAEATRRSNMMFKLTTNTFIKIPLPVEMRAIYGLGELAGTCAFSGQEKNVGEITAAAVGELTQLLPLDFMEGTGGIKAIVPSSVKPLWEAGINESWTGMPIYNNSEYNRNAPEWAKSYKSTNKDLVAISKYLNEKTGGNDVKKGKSDKVQIFESGDAPGLNLANPAQMEHILRGYFGGYFTFVDQLKKAGETIIGSREFQASNIPFLNRVVQTGDERTKSRSAVNEYYKYKEQAEETKRLLRGYEGKAQQGLTGYAELMQFLMESPEYIEMIKFDGMNKAIEEMQEATKVVTDEEQLKELDRAIRDGKKKIVEEMKKPIKTEGKEEGKKQ